MKTANNKLYHELNQPFENKDIANENINKFYEEIGELRKKYKIPDMLIIVNGSISYDDKVGEFMNMISYGDPLKVETLAAFGFGQAQAERRELINTILAHNAEGKIK